MARLDYCSALEAVWDLIKDANRYIEQEAPWNLAKSEDTWPRLETVLYNALEAVRIAALFTAPVMPGTSAEVWNRLGLGDIHAVTDMASEARWGQLPVGNRVTKGEPLYPRIYDEEYWDQNAESGEDMGKGPVRTAEDRRADSGHARASGHARRSCRRARARGHGRRRVRRRRRGCDRSA